jgi:hypothetical protein
VCAVRQIAEQVNGAEKKSSHRERIAKSLIFLQEDHSLGHLAERREKWLFPIAFA